MQTPAFLKRIIISASKLKRLNLEYASHGMSSNFNHSGQANHTYASTKA